MHDSFLKPALRIALLYVFLSTLWILLSDRLVVSLVDDPLVRNQLQTVKGWFFVLVTGALLYTLIRRSLKHMRAITLEDPLTHLPNRQAFKAELNARCSQGEGREVYFCTSILDIDHFKDLNDEHGHTEGDFMLDALRQSLQEFLNASWYIARLGSDEFGLLSPVELSKKDARAILDQLQRQLTRTSRTSRLHSLTLSLGTSFYPSDGTTSHDLLRHADMALSHAKAHGRDQHAVFKEDLKLQLMERIALLKDLRQACDLQTFDLVYQPQWDEPNQCWIGAEVLIRWHHPERGSVSPATFIPLAEEHGLSSQITKFVMTRALEELQTAGVDRHQLPRLSINLSHNALLDQHLRIQLGQQLTEPIERPELIVEITETAAMKNLQATLGAIQAWQTQGVTFSMDDFGTGYSSLSMLKKMPLRELKIDRSFIQDIPDNLNDAVITETILAMARTLSLEVVAEGVETIEQADFLSRHGCTIMQGFYYARPMPVSDLATLLRDAKKPTTP